MTTAYEYLIEHYGSEDLAKEKVEEYIKPFAGMISFEVGCEVKAQEHGWENPNKPKPVNLPTLSDEYFDMKIEENDSGYDDANITIEGDIVDISAIKTSEYELDGGDIIDTYVTVRLEDEGFSRDIRMHDHDSFVSRAGKEIKANHMATLWSHMRQCIGCRVKIRGVRVQRRETMDGPQYFINSGSFTSVKILEKQDNDIEELEEF